MSDKDQASSGAPNREEWQAMTEQERDNWAAQTAAGIREIFFPTR